MKVTKKNLKFEGNKSASFEKQNLKVKKSEL